MSCSCMYHHMYVENITLRLSAQSDCAVRVQMCDGSDAVRRACALEIRRYVCSVLRCAGWADTCQNGSPNDNLTSHKCSMNFQFRPVRRENVLCFFVVRPEQFPSSSPAPSLQMCLGDTKSHESHLARQDHVCAALRIQRTKYVERARPYSMRCDKFVVVYELALRDSTYWASFAVSSGRGNHFISVRISGRADAADGGELN